jgi:hypothetical protein
LQDHPERQEPSPEQRQSESSQPQKIIPLSMLIEAQKLERQMKSLLLPLSALREKSLASERQHLLDKEPYEQLKSFYDDLARRRSDMCSLVLELLRQGAVFENAGRLPDEVLREFAEKREASA